MGTKREPGQFDCYANAEGDEPMFILLARDAAAPVAVRKWMEDRLRRGVNRAGDAQMVEAGRCIQEMEEWYYANRDSR